MVSSLDVAAYILKKRGEMTAMKLQKLVYYCQAWSLVWDERPLFRDTLEAWANGPVAPSLFDAHRGSFKVSKLADGNPDALDQDAQDTVDAVLDFYGNKTSQWLSDLTHSEAPWHEARRRAGLAVGERGTALITHAAMAEYYSSL